MPNLCDLKSSIATGFVIVTMLTAPLWTGGQQRREGSRLPGKVQTPLRYKICTVSDLGRAKCLTSKQLSQTIGSVLTEAQADLVRSVLDAFLSDHGVGAGDILTECGNQWRSVDVSLVKANSSGPGFGSSGMSATLSSAEQRAVVGACSGYAGDLTTDLTGGGSGGGSGNRAHNDRLNSLLDKIDGAFSDCKDDSTKGIQQTSAVERAYIRDRGVPLKNIPGTETRNPFGRTWDANAHTESEIVYKIIFSEILTALDEFARAQEGQRHVDELNQARRDAEERMQQEGDGRASSEEEAAAQQCLEGTQCSNPEAPKSSYPGPDGTGSTCAEREAAWERFKKYCDRSNWREFRCDNLLRTVHGCVDIREIRPGPDGDALCHAGHTEDQKRKLAADKECEKRSGIAMPGENGQSLCKTLGAGARFRMPALDICNDPRAQCRQNSGRDMQNRQSRPRPNP